MLRKIVAHAAVVLAIAACGCASHHDDPQVLADETTRGVYDADYARTTEHFDAALKLQVTRGTIGQLSDQMHTLGAYRGLKLTSSDPDKGRYDYEATFDKGTMLVQMRLDPTQRIGAYRVAPQSSSTATR
ncbi:MAG: hypothetical protein JWM87_495 [Candidatus Eremiobacteraeota bacterium]|nr:hypothetical protein [Candidatus Eremiobacteraeota bacterium]